MSTRVELTLLLGPLITNDAFLLDSLKTGLHQLLQFYIINRDTGRYFEVKVLLGINCLLLI